GQATRLKVYSQDATAMRAQELHGEQTNQPETNDHHALTQCGLYQAYALQCDGTKHCQRRRFIAHTRGDLGTEILRYPYHLSMGTIGDNPISRGKPLHIGTNL